MSTTLPIYDAALVSPASGVTCRVWLADGSEHVASMFLGRWICTTIREDISPLRWQRLVPRYGNTGWPGIEPLQIPGPIPQWTD